MAAQPALERATPWLAAPAPVGLDPAALFAAHVRASRSRGVASWVAEAAVSVPGLMRRGLGRDSERNRH